MSLVELGPQHQDAFLKMMAEFESADPVTYRAVFSRKRAWSSDEFAAFLDDCTKQRLDWRPKAGKVSITRYVLPDPESGTLLAFGLMRFPLDHRTEKNGGNLF